MTMTFSYLPKTVTPTAADTLLAQDISRRLASHFKPLSGKPLQVRIASDDVAEETVVLPAVAFRLLIDMLNEMAKGNAVTMIPINAELTTQQAATILNVSRPFLIEQLEKNLIPYRKVGTHRRILFKDLMEFKQTTDANRLKVLDELTVEAQELDLGY